MIHIIGVIFTVVFALLTWAVWFAAMTYMIKAAKFRKPGVSFFGAFNLLVMIFSPEKYTEAGLHARRRCLQMIGWFFPLFLLTAILSVAFPIG
jgi:hypothetical protein